MWRKHGLQDLTAMIQRVRAELTACDLRGNAGWASPAATKLTARCPLAYSNLSTEPVDFLAEILISLGFELTPWSDSGTSATGPVVINCLDESPHRAATRLRNVPTDGIVAICDQEHLSQFRQLIRSKALPCSCAALLSACRG